MGERQRCAGNETGICQRFVRFRGTRRVVILQFWGDSMGLHRLRASGGDVVGAEAAEAEAR